MKHILQNKTFRRAHITFQHNFGAYFVGVIFGYVHHNIKHTGVKCVKVISQLILLQWPYFNMR